HGRHGGYLTRSGAPAESRSGVARGGDVALPGGEASRALVGADRRFEQALAPPGTLELVGGRPDAGRETGEIAGAERRRLQEGRDRPGAARIGHRRREGPTLCRRGDDAEPVPEPGDRRARRDGGALQAEGEASGAAP